MFVFAGAAAAVGNEKTQQVRVHHGRVERRHDHRHVDHIDHGIRGILAVRRRRQRQSHAQLTAHSHVRKNVGARRSE